MLRDNLLTFAVGAFFTSLALWHGRKIFRALRSLEERRQRSLEVSGTVTKVDFATESKRFQPTFAYRTFSGEDVTARSLLLFDRNDKNDLPYGILGNAVRLRYDPQNIEWVIPGPLGDKDLRRMRRKGIFAVGVFAFFGVLAFVTPFLPD